jgi:phospholipid-binding lipoprotein MlaA
MSTQKTVINNSLLWPSLLMSLTLGGCASSTTAAHQNDPWQGWNHGTQSFNDEVDKRVLKPLAKGYQWATNDTIDQGVSNFFSNINDIGVTVNDLLQFKLTQGGMDASRFLVNTTAGVAGVVDVAGMIDLPKHNEDFGQTLGFWGVPSGPYLVLPLFGPSSPRETVGRIGDALLNPLTYVSALGGTVGSAASAGSSAVDVVDRRAEAMTTEKIVDEAAVDRYDFIKSAYEQRRDYLVNDGNVPEADDLSLEDDSLLETDSAVKSNVADTNKTNSPEAAPSVDKPEHFLDLAAPEDK